MNMIANKKYIVGLDIGSSSIKSAVFINKKGEFCLIKADIKEFERIKYKEVSEESIISALKASLADINLKESCFFVSIEGANSMIKPVLVPKMPLDELRRGMILDSERYFQSSGAELILDVEVQTDINVKDAQKLAVLAAVCERQKVENILSMLLKAHVEPVTVIPASYALSNLAKKFSKDESKVNCFIEIGENFTELIILKGRKIDFSRKLPVVGRDFTKALTAVLISSAGKTALEYEQAEDIKCKVGIPEQGDTQIVDNKISKTQILSMLWAPLEQLVGEINRSFSHYREESGGSNVDEVFLSGGASLLKRLPEILSEGLSLPVKLLDISESFSISSDILPAIQPIFHRLTCALGAVFCRKDSVNLLPPQIKGRTALIIKRGIIESTGIILFVLLLLFFMGLKIKQGSLQNKLFAVNLELSGLQPALLQSKEKIRASVILENEPYWQEILKELSNSVPPGIYITELSLDKQLITIRGRLQKQAQKTLISDFIFELEKGILREVSLLNTKDLQGEEVCEFQLQAYPELK